MAMPTLRGQDERGLLPEPRPIVRFCQQCGEFQLLTDFDGFKKTCRK